MTLPLAALAATLLANSVQAAVILEQLPAGNNNSGIDIALENGRQSFTGFTLSDAASLRRVAWQGSYLLDADPSFTVGIYKADGPDIGVTSPGTLVYEMSGVATRVTGKPHAFSPTFSATLESLYEIDLDADVLLEANTGYWLSVMYTEPGFYAWQDALPLPCCSVTRNRDGTNAYLQGGLLSFGLYDDRINPLPLAEVPEPAALALLGLASLSLVGRRRLSAGR